MKDIISFYPYPRIEDLQALHRWLSEIDEEERIMCFGTHLPEPGMTVWSGRKPSYSLMVNPLYRDSLDCIVNRALKDGIPFGKIGFFDNPQDIRDCCLYAKVWSEQPSNTYHDSLDYLRPANDRYWEVEADVSVIEEDSILVGNYSEEDCQGSRNIRCRKAMIVIRLFPHGKSAPGITAFRTEMSLHKDFMGIFDDLDHLKLKYRKDKTSGYSWLIEKLDEMDFDTILKRSKVNAEDRYKTSYEGIVNKIRKMVRWTEEFLPGIVRDRLEAAFTHHALALDKDDPYFLFIKPVLESAGLRDVFFRKRRSKDNYLLYEVPFASWFLQTDDRIWGLFPVMSRSTEVILESYNEGYTKTGCAHKDKIHDMKQAFQRLLVKKEKGLSDMDSLKKAFEDAVNKGMKEYALPERDYTDNEHPLRVESSKENVVEYGRPYGICYLFLKSMEDGKSLSVTNSTKFKDTEDMLEFYRKVKDINMEEFWNGKAKLEFSRNWRNNQKKEVRDLYDIIVNGKGIWKEHWTKMVLYSLLPEKSQRNLYMYSSKYLKNKKARQKVMDSMTEDKAARMLFAYDIYRSYRVNGHMEDEIQDFLLQEPELSDWIRKYETAPQRTSGTAVDGMQALEMERRRRDSALLEG